MTAYLLYPVARTRSRLFAMCGTSQSRFRKSWKNSSSLRMSLRTRSLKIIGWKGPKVALKAIKDAAKSFAKKEQ